MPCNGAVPIGDEDGGLLRDCMFDVCNCMMDNEVEDERVSNHIIISLFMYDWNELILIEYRLQIFHTIQMKILSHVLAKRLMSTQLNARTK